MGGWTKKKDNKIVKVTPCERHLYLPQKVPKPAQTPVEDHILGPWNLKAINSHVS